MSPLLLPLLAALLAPEAAAQDTATDGTVDFAQFRPHLDAHGYLGVPSATTLGHLQLNIGIWAGFENDPLVLTRNGERISVVPGASGEDGDALVDSRLRGDLQLGFGFLNWASLAVGVPVVLFQDGVDPAGLSSGELATLDKAGMGDLVIQPRFSPLRAGQELPIGIGIGLPIEVPTGKGEALMGEGAVSFVPSLTIEAADGDVLRRDHFVRAAVHSAYRIRQADRVHDARLGNAFEYGIAGAIHPAEPLELVAELAGSAGGTSAVSSLESRLGLRLLPSDAVAVNLGGGLGLAGGVGSADWRVIFGLTISPSFDPAFRDLDRDGLTDARDRCIQDPEDIDSFQDEDGCPEPDNDLDGILDGDDVCPDDAEDDDGFQDSDGCPDPDNDGDGIPDVADRCPLAPESFNDNMDDDGCPDEDRGDRDGDGYLDDVDRCPMDAEDRDGWQDEDGCPDLDNDADGIPDTSDQCPNEKEVFNGQDDEDGCPDDGGRVEVQDRAIAIKEAIYFDSGRATIQSRSNGLLDEIAAVFVAHPEIKLVRVEGHTDSQGGESTNLRLSDARAREVRKYLISKGVAASRLDARGFGEMYPIAPNDTADGRARNRRVEFVIVERD
jgi:outer membrane protein OmpA-like peptidoglycan-associated protein